MKVKRDKGVIRLFWTKNFYKQLCQWKLWSRAHLNMCIDCFVFLKYRVTLFPYFIFIPETGVGVTKTTKWFQKCQLSCTLVNKKFPDFSRFYRTKNKIFFRGFYKQHAKDLRKKKIYDVDRCNPRLSLDIDFLLKKKEKINGCKTITAKSAFLTKEIHGKKTNSLIFQGGSLFFSCFSGTQH